MERLRGGRSSRSASSTSAPCSSTCRPLRRPRRRGPAPSPGPRSVSPLSREVISFDAHLGQHGGPDRGRRPRGAATRDQPAPAAAPAAAGTARDRPPGHFHPQNILSEGGVVTGVLDWPNALVADPAYDVASTRIILALTPIALSGVPAALRWVASFVRLMLVKRYLAGMRRRRPLDPRCWPTTRRRARCAVWCAPASTAGGGRARRRVPSTPRRSGTFSPGTSPASPASFRHFPRGPADPTGLRRELPRPGAV